MFGNTGSHFVPPERPPNRSPLPLPEKKSTHNKGYPQTPPPPRPPGGHQRRNPPPPFFFFFFGGGGGVGGAALDPGCHNQLVCLTAFWTNQLCCPYKHTHTQTHIQTRTVLLSSLTTCPCHTCVHFPHVHVFVFYTFTVC